MSQATRSKDLGALHGVRTRVAFPASIVLAATLFLVLGSASAKGQDSAWKPSWQLPPTSSSYRMAADNSSPVKAAAPTGAENRTAARTQAAADGSQTAARTRTYPVRPASAQMESPKDPSVKPIPQPETVPQGQVISGMPSGPMPGEIIGSPDAVGYGYPGCDACGCGTCDDGCSFRLPIDARCFRPLHGIVYTRAAYLMWWPKGSDTPPLVSTGALPGGTVLFGNSPLNEGMRSGVQTALGLWLDPCQMSGVEAVYTGIGKDVDTYHASEGTLVRPFFDTSTGLQNGSPITGAGISAGAVDIRSDSDFQAFDLLYRHAMAEQCGFRIDGLFGYRYTRLDEGLGIGTVSDYTVGGRIRVLESFRTLNEFSGGELGANLQWRWNRWSFSFLSKMALGYTRMKVGIAGTTITTAVDGTRLFYTGGLLAQPNQVGDYSQTQFTVNPELGLTVGYDLTCRLRATFGYSMLYWSKVARPGDQISTNINPATIPPLTLDSPSFPGIATTDFWVQGLNFGLEYRF